MVWDGESGIGGLLIYSSPPILYQTFDTEWYIVWYAHTKRFLYLNYISGMGL